MALYSQIDQQTRAFQAETQLHCPTGCGRCCENPHVEATLLEMVPLAVELFRQGEAVKWLESADESNETNACLFYEPDPRTPGNGRCQVYPWRPSICRLFGYATVSDRDGQPRFAACMRHKADIPEVVVTIQEAIAQGLPAPSFATSQQIAHLAPQLGAERMPINQALSAALRWVGLNFQMKQTELDSN
ncbi:MAG: YkgJ family cysteine cluster protein [Leptolyngbyaceae cyanobacterium SM1_4_3]|nr:YkgJ family cysteine cluster protein [Leptolyngbyaceae cyanobacterium SM1_4_3]